MYVAYRIQDTETGLFRSDGGWWTKHGKRYTTAGDVRNALSQIADIRAYRTIPATWRVLEISSQGEKWTPVHDFWKHKQP